MKEKEDKNLKVTFKLPKNTSKKEESSKSEGFCTLDINVSKRIESSIKSDIKKSTVKNSSIKPEGFPKDVNYKLFTKRIKGMGEIFESEKIYFRDLITWGHEFKSKLLDSDSMNLKRKTDICNSIFAGFDKIIDLHGKIIENIIDSNQLVYKRKGNERFNSINLLEIENFKYLKTETYPGIKDLEDLNYTIIYIKYLPQYYSYIDYVKGLPRAEYELESEYKRNEKFKKTVDDFLKEYKMKNLGIKHFLYRPSQKLNRYSMLFKAVAKVEKIDLYKNQIFYLLKELGKINKSVDITFGLINKQFECFKLSKELKYDKDLKITYPLNLLLKSQKIIKRGNVLVDVSNLNNSNLIPLSLEIIILTDVIIFTETINKGFDKLKLIKLQPLHLLKLVLVNKPLNPISNPNIKKYEHLYTIEKGSDTFITILFKDPITRDVYKQIISKQINVLEKKMDKNFLLVENKTLPNINIINEGNKYNMILMEKIKDWKNHFKEINEEQIINTDLGVFDVSLSESSSKSEKDFDSNILENCGCLHMKDNEFYKHVLESNLEISSKSYYDIKSNSIESIKNKEYSSNLNDCCNERIINSSSKSLTENYIKNDKIIIKDKSFINSKVIIKDKSFINNNNIIINKKKQYYINKSAITTQEKILDIIGTYAQDKKHESEPNLVVKEKLNIEPEKIKIEETSMIKLKKSSMIKPTRKINESISNINELTEKSDLTTDSSKNKDYLIEKLDKKERKIFEKIFLKPKGKKLQVQNMERKYIKTIKNKFHLNKNMILLATNSGLFKLTKKIEYKEKEENKILEGKKVKLFNKPTNKIYYNSILSILIFLSENKLYVSKFNHFYDSIDPLLIIEDCENFFFNNLKNTIAVIKKTEGDIISIFLYDIFFTKYNKKITNKEIKEELENMESKQYSFYKNIKIYYKKAIKLEDIKVNINLQHKLFIGTLIETIYFSKNVLIVGGTQFETINPDTLKARELIDPLDLIIPYYFEFINNISCKKLYLIGDKYLVIYNKIGFFIDKYGSTIDKHLIFPWISELEDCFVLNSNILMKISKISKKCHYQNLLLVLSKNSYEIWNLDNGIILNYCIKKNLKFISNLNIPIMYDDEKIYSLSLNN